MYEKRRKTEAKSLGSVTSLVINGTQGPGLEERISTVISSLLYLEFCDSNGK